MQNLRDISKIGPSEIHEALSHEIVNFDLMPGEIVSENSLAERFNTSRTTVRTAIQWLEQDILVTVVPQKGTFVTYLSHQYVTSVMHIKFLVEYDAICALIDKGAGEVVVKAKELVGQMNQDNLLNARKYLDLNEEFHELMYSSLENTYIWNNINRLDKSCRRYKSLMVYTVPCLCEILKKQDLFLLDCIEEGDKSSLKVALKEQIFSGINDLKLELGDAWTEYFED